MNRLCEKVMAFLTVGNERGLMSRGHSFHTVEARYHNLEIFATFSGE